MWKTINQLTNEKSKTTKINELRTINVIIIIIIIILLLLL